MSSPTVEAIELRRISLPLVRPFETSFGTWTERDILLVRVYAGDTEGWGECVAATTPTYSGEYTDGAHRVISRHLGSLLVGRSLGAASVPRLLTPFKGHRMAKAALEAAVFDAELRLAGRSMADALGGTRPAVPVGVSVGIPDSLDELCRTVDEHLEDGYRRVKLKIKPGFDVEPVETVRNHVGSEVELQVDGNAAYRAEEIDHRRALLAMDPLGLALIEQPFPEEQLLAHALLAEQIETPLCLDESILDRSTTADALDLRACSIVNVKAGRVGGLVEAASIHDLCLERDVPVWCGGMLETGIGRAGNLALASLPGFTLPGDISASSRYWNRDVVTEPFTVDADGTMAVPTGPGLGVEVDLDFIESVTTEVEIVVAP